jgi:thioredoxin reductase (NADPH)
MPISGNTMSLAENRRDQMFPVFDAGQMETAKRFASGPARAFAQGETIFNVGERHASVWFVLKGEIVIMRRDGLSNEAEVARMGVGQFTGEMSELSGRGTLASGRAGPEGCTALPFDAAHIRALIVGSAELGEILMRAFILRRVGLLQTEGAGSVDRKSVV